MEPPDVGTAGEQRITRCCTRKVWRYGTLFLRRSLKTIFYPPGISEEVTPPHCLACLTLCPRQEVIEPPSLTMNIVQYPFSTLYVSTPPGTTEDITDVLRTSLLPLSLFRMSLLLLHCRRSLFPLLPCGRILLSLLFHGGYHSSHWLCGGYHPPLAMPWGSAENWNSDLLSYNHLFIANPNVFSI